MKTIERRLLLMVALDFRAGDVATTSEGRSPNVVLFLTAKRCRRCAVQLDFEARFPGFVQRGSE